jgi:hypothetical protein
MHVANNKFSNYNNMHDATIKAVIITTHGATIKAVIITTCTSQTINAVIITTCTVQQ